MPVVVANDCTAIPMLTLAERLNRPVSVSWVASCSNARHRLTAAVMSTSEQAISGELSSVVSGAPTMRTWRRSSVAWPSGASSTVMSIVASDAKLQAVERTTKDVAIRWRDRADQAVTGSQLGERGACGVRRRQRPVDVEHAKPAWYLASGKAKQRLGAKALRVPVARWLVGSGHHHVPLVGFG